MPAEWVGSWTLVEVWATPTEGPLAGQTIAGHGDARCVRLGWDNALSSITIAADGTFVGPFISDSVEDWSGALVAPVDPNAAPGARAMRVDDCHFCYDHDTEIGKLGHIVVVDGHLELTRTAHLEFDEDGDACALCTAEGSQFPEGRTFWNAQVRLRCAPAAGPGSTQSLCWPCAGASCYGNGEPPP